MRARFLTVGVSCYKFKKGEYCVVGLELEVSQYELEVLICMQMDRHKNRYRVYECVFPFLWLCPQGLEARISQQQGAHLVLRFDF